MAVSPIKRVSTARWRGKLAASRQPVTVLPRAQVISPVLGKTFNVSAPQTTLLTNLHRTHRALMDALALELNLTIEYRADVRFSNGKPNPNAYAVHVLFVGGVSLNSTPPPLYDRDAVLQELHTRIIAAWNQKQKESTQ